MLPASLCHAVLARYGLRPRALRPLAAQVVRVDADDGRRYALRCRPRADRAFGSIPLELAWTAALRAETEVRPPIPVAAADGELVQDVAGDDGPHDCALFDWIAGPALAQRFTPQNLRALGALSARLHEHAATYRPPVGIPARRLDRLVRDGERDVLLAHDHPRFLPQERRAVFEAVRALFLRELTDLYADSVGLRVVHADLHHDNVKLDRGRLRPLDFYEVVWAYPVQDVALTLYDLRYSSPADRRARGRRAGPSPTATHPGCPGPRPTPVSSTCSSRGGSCAAPTTSCGAKRPRSPTTRPPPPTPPVSTRSSPGSRRISGPCLRAGHEGRESQVDGLVALLGAAYGARDVALVSLAAEGERAVYRVDRTAGPP